VINVELARIEQQWRVDSDAEKPGKFTKDMTYHSIRKLAKNILARQTKLPEQYADLRAGLCRKYNKDSTKAYVKLNWHMDSMCGRVLAGVDSIYSGGCVQRPAQFHLLIILTSINSHWSYWLHIAKGESTYSYPLQKSLFAVPYDAILWS